jgi:outer membrane protein OmpA-like peptidoglycan-associated protein
MDGINQSGHCQSRKERIVMKKCIVAVLVLAVFLSACAMPATNTKEGQGTLWGSGIGAAAGAGLGQAIGHSTKATLLGAGIGALVGGVAGNRVGAYMDHQEAELRQQLANVRAVEIQRENNLLQLTFHSDLTFATGSATPSAGAVEDLQRVARVLNQYPQTTIQVAGYTDNTGSEEFNQKLSERRAEAVKNILLTDGVSPSRIVVVGYGESQPVASNATAAGRQLNRRVVVTIAPVQAKG